MNKLSRQEAWELLTEYTETPALQKHALQAETRFAGGRRHGALCPAGR